jgi:hypothetical protein
MTTIIDGSSGITYPNSTVQASAGQVLQVVSTTLTSAFSSTSSSWTNWTGLTATITPKFSTSKIFVQITSSASNSTTNTWQFVKIQRNGTDMVLGDAVGSATRCFSNGGFANNSLTPNIIIPLLGIYLDSPATTSAVTYQAQIIVTNGGTAYFGRTADTVDLNRGTNPSTITLMEIAG